MDNCHALLLKLSTVAYATFIAFLAPVHGVQAATLQLHSRLACPYVMRKIIRHRGTYDVEIAFPFFAPNDRSLRQANHWIKQSVSAIQSEHNRSYWEGDPLGTRGYLKAKYSVQMCTPELVAIRADVENYSPGAATSERSQAFYNLALKPFRLLSINKDVFLPGVDYELVLSVLSTKALLETKSNIALIDELVARRKHDFLLAKDCLELYFPADAPSGYSCVKIPYLTISALVAPQSPLANLINKQRKDGGATIVLNRHELTQQLAILAIGTYTQVISEDPENALAYRQRGTWYKLLGREAVAEKDLAMAQQLAGR